jgi:hypothetical protein
MHDGYKRAKTKTNPRPKSPGTILRRPKPRLQREGRSRPRKQRAHRPVEISQRGVSAVMMLEAEIRRRDGCAPDNEDAAEMVCSEEYVADPGAMVREEVQKGGQCEAGYAAGVVESRCCDGTFVRVLM